MRRTVLCSGLRRAVRSQLLCLRPAINRLHSSCRSSSVGLSPLLTSPVALVQPLRWCSSTTIGGHSSATDDSPASSSSPSPPSSRDAAATPEAPVAGDASQQPYPPEVEAQIREWQERLKGLSAEDQQLIISSLLHPELQKPSAMGGPGIGPEGADMVAAFTCGQCDFRMVKKFSKHAYTKGIVIVECPNCRGKHLLADNLGWFENEARNVEDILREKGEHFIRVGAGGDYQVVAAGEGEQPPQGE